MRASRPHGCGQTEEVRAGRPPLAICLGLQLLALGSEESPGVAGLAHLPATVRRIPSGVPVPQLGWNRVSPTPGAALLEAGHAYFANSYCLPELPPGWAGATVVHARVAPESAAEDLTRAADLVDQRVELPPS